MFGDNLAPAYFGCDEEPDSPTTCGSQMLLCKYAQGVDASSMVRIAAPQKGKNDRISTFFCRGVFRGWGADGRRGRACPAAPCWALDPLRWRPFVRWEGCFCLSFIHHRRPPSLRQKRALALAAGHQTRQHHQPSRLPCCAVNPRRLAPSPGAVAARGEQESWMHNGRW